MDIKKILFVSGIALTGLFAKEEINIDQISNFYYKQGFSYGYKSGYERGYQDAINFAKYKLDEYLLKIKSYEAGKYLIETKKITYPQIFYIEMSDGSIKVVIKNSRIEKEISPEDIIYIPELKQENFQDIKKVSQNENSTVSNSVSLDDYSSNVDVPNSSGSDLKTFIVYMPNTETYKNILNKAGLVYAEDGDRLKIIFISKKNAETFIKNFGLEKDKDYFLN